MKKNLLIIFSFLLFTSCCKDQIVNSFTFNSFERNIIPYSGYDNYNFVDQNGEINTAVSTPVKLITDTERPGPESCDLSQYQELKSRLRFPQLSFDLEIEINSLFETRMHLQPIEYDENSFGKIYLERDYGDYPLLEEALKNITIAGFEYENVLVFKDYNDISKLHRIIFSPQNGIEFIEFDDGNYLRYTP